MSGLDAAVVSTGGPVGSVTEIEILEALGEPTRFRFRVPAPVENGDFPALSNSAYDPGAVIVIVASMAPVMRGVVTGQRARLSGDSETSYVEVLGQDRTAEMDREAKITSWPMMRAADAVMAIVATYGMIPDVAATGTIYTPLDHELVQRGTDLEFVGRLARRHGYLFWLSLNEIGLETAHFKPAPVDGSSEATLALHLEASAFDEMEISWDAARPTAVTASGLSIGDLSSIDASVAAPPLASMAGSNLAAVNGGGHTALAVAHGDDAATISGAAKAILADAELFVRAEAATTMARAGKVLHAHQIVSLDGLGTRHSGNWLIAEVRHLIDAVSHRMECTFVRNGWET